MIFRGRRWMTLGKAAKLLGTSRNTLRVLLMREKEHGLTVDVRRELDALFIAKGSRYAS